MKKEISIQSNKFLDRLKKWNNACPETKNYRYKGHKTIYKSSIGEFMPSERQILVHRALHRKWVNKYVKFWYQQREGRESGCWLYVLIINISHQNTYSAYGEVCVTYYCANTCTMEKLSIGINTTVVYEELEEKEFVKINNLIQINN